MLKKIIASFLLFGTLPLFSEPTKLSPIVDFSRLPGNIDNYFHYDKESVLLGNMSFNYAPELIPFFAMLKRDYHIDAVVETGTFRGGSTVAFSLLFDEVHTIDTSPEFYNETKQLLKNFKNIKFHLGSSELVMRDLLPSLEEKRVLYYLDAHWQDEWPLLDELEMISKTHRDNCIVVIDDFKVPGRNEIPHDAYKNKACSYEYIKDQLDKVFSEYSMHYIIPRNIRCRAKFVAIPKNWQPRNY